MSKDYLPMSLDEQHDRMIYCMEHTNTTFLGNHKIGKSNQNVENTDNKFHFKIKEDLVEMI